MGVEAFKLIVIALIIYGLIINDECGEQGESYT